MTVDKEQLLKARLPEADVELDGIGTVRVRGLSRAEALSIQKVAGSGITVMERKMLALAMVSPRMSEGDIREWQDAAPAGELEPVTVKVQELSGMTAESAKDAYKEFDADPAGEFRVLLGEDAGDDGGADAADDEQ